MNHNLRVATSWHANLKRAVDQWHWTTKTGRRLILLLVPVWLLVRFGFTDGFPFHLISLTIIILAATHYRKERALLVTMVVAMVDSEGVLYNQFAAHNFLVRSLFFFAAVFVVDFIRKPGDELTTSPQAHTAKTTDPESLSLLDNSRWEHRFTLEEVSAALVGLCRQMATFHSLIYFSYDQSRKMLRGEVRVSHSPHLMDPLIIPLGVGLVGRLAHKRERKYISKYNHDSRTLHYYRKPEKIGSILVIPVSHAGKLSGVLVLDSKTPAHFSGTQIETLQSVAASFDQLWHLSVTEVDYQDHLTKYRLLLEVQHKLTEASDNLTATEKILLDYVARLVTGDSYGVYYPGDAASTVLLNDRARLIRNSVAWVSRRRQSLRIGNVKGEQHLLQGIKRDRFATSFQSLLVVPVMTADDVAAVIVVEGRQVNQFRPIDEEALKILASQVGAAFNVARSRDRARQSRLQAEALLEATAKLCSSIDYQGAQEGILEAFAQLIPHRYLLFYRMDGRHPKLTCGLDWEGEMPARLMQCRALYRVAGSCRVTEIEDILTANEPVERRDGTRSLLLIPIGTCMKTTGIIEIGSSKVAAFSNIDDALLERLRDTASRWWEAVVQFRENRDELITDEITGVGNTRFLTNYLLFAARRLQAGQWRGLTIMGIAVDELRTEMFNPGEWDRTLQRFRDVIEDIMPPTSRLVLRRGDEFFVMLPNIEKEDANELGGVVMKRLTTQEIYCRGIRKSGLTVNVGLASGVSRSVPQQILARADEALNRARHGA